MIILNNSNNSNNINNSNSNSNGSDSSHVGGSGFDRTYIFGKWYSMEVPLIEIPLTIWGTYFFSLWIAKGYMGKKQKSHQIQYKWCLSETI